MIWKMKDLAHPNIIIPMDHVSCTIYENVQGE